MQYPDTWQLDPDGAEQIPRSVTIRSPGGAFWSLDIHPFSKQPDELSAEAVAIMRDEYADLECHPTAETIGNERAEGLDLYFSCLDFVVTAQMRCFRRGHATYFLLYQAEDREFEQLERVFRAMTESLMRESSR